MQNPLDQGEVPLNHKTTEHLSKNCVLPRFTYLRAAACCLNFFWTAVARGRESVRPRGREVACITFSSMYVEAECIGRPLKGRGLRETCSVTLNTQLYIQILHPNMTGQSGTRDPELATKP